MYVEDYHIEMSKYYNNSFRLQILKLRGHLNLILLPTVFPLIVHALELYTPLNCTRTFWHCLAWYFLRENLKKRIVPAGTNRGNTVINVQCYSHYSRLCNLFIFFHSCNTFSSQNLICEIIARQFVHLKKTTCASILIFERQQLTRVEFFPQNRLFFWKTETLYATLLNVPNYSFKNWGLFTELLKNVIFFFKHLF